MEQLSALLEALDQLLQQEYTVHRQLLELQKTIRHCLVTQALEPFLDKLQELDGLLQHLKTLSKQRSSVLAALTARLSLPATATLRQLSEHLGEPYASRFHTHRTQLRNLLQELQQLIAQNATLIQHSLAFIDEALALFTRLLPTQPTYQQTGTFPTQTQGRLLSQKA